MRLPRQWRRAPEILRWRGLFRFMLLAGREIFRPFMYWYIYNIVQADLQQPLPEPYAKGHFEVRIYGGEKDLERVKSELCPMGELTPGDIKSRFNTGELVAVAYAESRPVGYSWMNLSGRWVLPFETTLIVHPNEAVLYDAFVHPQWRGRGINSCLDVALSKCARERGIVRTLGSMAVWNSQALSLAKRLGKTKIMTLVLVRVRGVNWTWRRAFGAPLNTRLKGGAS